MIDLIKGPAVYTPQGILHDTDVLIHQGKICGIEPTKKRMVSSLKTLSFPSSYYLVPGFIDLHVHGADGCDVMDATPDALFTLSKALAAEGTTSYLATTMTASVQHIEKTLQTIAYYRKNTHFTGANIEGIHLEGPFISPEKAGAQHPHHIVLPNHELMDHFQTLSDRGIKIVTFAPECINSEAFIQYLTNNHIVAAIGHSDATFDQTMKAIQSGCHYVTHLFNAMRGIHQREPGVVTAALLSENVWTELIVDNIHLHPAIVQLILKMKGKEKMVLVTDAMRAKCLKDGEYELGGQSVHVKKGVASLPDGTLAGSTLSMFAAIKNTVKNTQCSLLEAIQMASQNPANVLKIFHKKGSISLNKDADLVVLNEDFRVVLTLLQGHIIYQAS